MFEDYTYTAHFEKYIKEPMTQMARQKEDIVRNAIGAALGFEMSISDIIQRCRWIHRAGEAFETLYVDGEPVLELHELEMSGPTLLEDRYVYSATQKYRLLGRAAKAGDTLPETPLGRAFADPAQEIVNDALVRLDDDGEAQS